MTRSVLLALLAPTLVVAQARPFEVHEASVTEIQQALTTGRVTSLQLVDAYLARIAAYDASGPELNSYIRVSPRARADAQRLDDERRAGRVRGPLHGVPIALKDNYDTFDMPTSGGLLAFASLQPKEDAFVVKKLRDAGAIIIGKTNLHELAHGITTISSLGGQTRNPYDPQRNPGGSSGGTGAAVAASLAAVGWGSDTCGSIRIPCSVNNLVGLRPTQGTVSRVGIMPLSHTQDIGGPLARTVTDLAIALDATFGFDPKDPPSRMWAGRQLPRFTDSLRADALRASAS
jgi:amidase